MNSRTRNEELRTCLTHQPFHSRVSEVSETSETSEASKISETSETSESEIPVQPLTCSSESYMGIVSKSSLSHQAAAIRRLQERRKKFDAFMPK